MLIQSQFPSGTHLLPHGGTDFMGQFVALMASISNPPRTMKNDIWKIDSALPPGFFLGRAHKLIHNFQMQQAGRDFRANFFCAQTYCASGRRNWDPRRKLIQRQNRKRIVASINRVLRQTEKWPAHQRGNVRQMDLFDPDPSNQRLAPAVKLQVYYRVGRTFELNTSQQRRVIRARKCQGRGYAAAFKMYGGSDTTHFALQYRNTRTTGLPRLIPAVKSHRWLFQIVEDGHKK